MFNLQSFVWLVQNFPVYLETIAPNNDHVKGSGV